MKSVYNTLPKLLPHIQKEIYNVDLNLPAKERWNEVLDQSGDKIHSMFSDIEDLIAERTAELPPKLRPLAKGVIGPIGHLLSAIVKAYGQDYVYEIQGIAARAGINYPRLLLANLMYDITQAFTPASPAACTSYSVNLPGGKPCLARNMDWDMPDTMGTNTVLVRFHKGNRYYLSVGVVGMVGVLSAMRPGHWAVTLNQAPRTHGCMNYFGGMPALQQVRSACDQFGSFNSLISHLQDYQSLSPFFIHVVGVKPTDHAILTSFGSTFSIRQTDVLPLVQTNHFVEPKFKDLNPPAETEDENGQVWVCNSEPRYKAIERRFQKNRPRSVSNALDLLKREPVTNSTTMQSMAFCPARDEYQVRVQLR